MLSLPGWEVLGPKIKKCTTNNWQFMLVFIFAVALFTIAFNWMPIIIEDCNAKYKAQHQSYMVKITNVKSEVTGDEEGFADVNEMVYCDDLKTGQSHIFINGEFPGKVNQHCRGCLLLTVKLQEPFPLIVKGTDITKDAVWHSDDPKPTVDIPQDTPTTSPTTTSKVWIPTKDEEIEALRSTLESVVRQQAELRKENADLKQQLEEQDVRE